MIKDHCVENNIIDEVEEKPTVEVLELKLDFEREEQRLEREEAKKARDAEKAALEAEAEGKRACEEA